MSPARLQYRVQMQRRLNALRRMQASNPSIAQWFDDSIQEIENELRNKESGHKKMTTSDNVIIPVINK